jgi:glutathione S-transferase
MALTFYGHPLSSYCQKVLVALYEHGIPFEWKLLSQETPQNGAEFAGLWPLLHMPVLTDGDRVLRESTIIIEYLDLKFAKGSRLIPQDASRALDVRFFDRVFDNYVMARMQTIVAERLRPSEARDPFGVARARERLDLAYGWLDGVLQDGWLAGDAFSMADCAAAPALFYADKVQPLGGRFPKVAAYLERLEARVSNARVRDEARPYWHLFPFAGESVS